MINPMYAILKEEGESEYWIGGNKLADEVLYDFFSII